MNRNHAYFYQVQIQMAVCHVDFCYFYIWSDKIQIPPLKIPFEPTFWREKSVKAFRFAKNVIIPELMNSFYTKTYDFTTQ